MESHLLSEHGDLSLLYYVSETVLGGEHLEHSQSFKKIHQELLYLRNHLLFASHWRNFKMQQPLVILNCV